MHITRNISELLHKTSILAKESYILKGKHWLLCFDNIYETYEVMKTTNSVGTQLPLKTPLLSTILFKCKWSDCI